ncbi:MAG: chromate transporter [Clostridia bacterium]|nr:chromate transporter [Clostridia bacterium]
MLFNLFFTFFKIGLFTFGGGYAMIPLITQEVLSNQWLTEDALINFIAISESTPGPFAINIATFVGASQGGVLGAGLATLGVVLPSFVIILLVASIFTMFEKNKYVKGALLGISPVVCALILGTGLSLFIKNVWTNAYELNSTPILDFKALIIATIAFVGSLLYKKLTKKNLSAILVIVFGAVAGIIVY